MTPLRAAPREIYRLYDEDAFLAGAGSEPEPMEVASVSRIARAAGAAALLGVLGTIGTVFVLSGEGPGLASRKRPASASRLGAIVSAYRLAAGTLRGTRMRGSPRPAPVGERRAHSRRRRAVRPPTAAPTASAADVSSLRADAASRAPLGAPVVADAASAAVRASGSEFGFER